MALPTRGTVPRGNYPRCKSMLHGPSSPQAVLDQLAIQAHQSRPIADRFSFPAKGQPKIVAFVIGLLQRSRPATVAGFIVPIVIDPVDTHSRGNGAHISQKRFESEPSLADLNSTRTIVGIFEMIGIQTATLHGTPSPIFPTMSKTMSFAMTSRLFAAVAPTAPRMTHTQGSPRHDSFIAASTVTAPSRSMMKSWLRLSTLNHGKSPEDMAHQIYGRPRHKGIITDLGLL